MILVFLWSTPFVVPKPEQAVYLALVAEFRAHPQILAVVDVAGHVQHACSSHGCDVGRFVMDVHHPSTAVHLWIAVELHQIVYKYIKEDRRSGHVPPLPAARAPEHTAAATETWTCDDTPNGPKLWTRLFAEPHRAVSWTADEPALPEQGLAITMAGGAMELIDLGKAAKTRVDKLKAVQLPHCSQEHSLAFQLPPTCPNPVGFSYHLGASEQWPRLHQEVDFQVTGLTVEKTELTGCYMSQKPSFKKAALHFQHWGLLSDSAASSENLISALHPAAPSKDAIQIRVCTRSAEATMLRWVSVLCGA